MSFFQDLRYAARGLARRPALLTVTTTALCIGIAANAVMFGVVDQLLLRAPAHVASPDAVKRIYYRETRDGVTGSQPVTNYPLVAALQRNTPAFSEVAAFFGGSYSMGRGADARSVDVQLVTGNYFRLLGVRPAIGRAFAPGEDTIPRGAPVAVVSHGFWRRELGGARDVVGRVLYVHGTDLTVIGVAPEGFSGLDRSNTDLWVPISAMASEAFTRDWHSNALNWWVQAIGRLRPDATVEQAEAQGTAVFRAQLRELKQRWRDSSGTVVLGSIVGARAPNGVSPEGKVSLWLMGVSLVVLLIACANVANLLIARTVERRREIAVRLALGAGRGRLLRMLLAESALLAVLAAGAALAMAYWASRVVQQILLPGIVWSDSVVDARVLAFTLGVTVVCVLLAGAAPALQGIRVSVTEGLKAGARQVAGGRSTLRHTLLVIQAGLSIVLLIGAGLFVRSLRNVTGRDVGIDLDRVLLVTMDLGRAGFGVAQRTDVYQRAQERVRGMPGVARTALARSSVPGQSGAAMGFRIPGVDTLPRLDLGGPYGSVVTADFFPTMGTRVIRGRNFTDDEGRVPSRVMIINEMLAKAYFPGEDPVGRCVLRTGDSTCTEIVGVVENVMLFQMVRDDRAMIYLPPSHPSVAEGSPAALLVRATGDPATLIPLVQRELQQLAPNMPFVQVRSYADVVAPQLQPWRLGAAMFTLFGGIALVIAAVGLYSAMAYWVAQRTQEIGVRMALGAQRGDIVRLVAWQTSRAVALGLLFGAIAAALASRWVADLLYETSPRDPLVYGMAAAALALAALAASVIPARRSTAVDPALALRAE